MELEMFCIFLGLGLPLYAPCIFDPSSNWQRIWKILTFFFTYFMTHFDSFVPISSYFSVNRT